MSRLTPSLLALDKGLDLQTAKIIAPEGSVFDTLNYEQVDFQGQKRIDGYVRYDGTKRSDSDDYLVVQFESDVSYDPGYLVVVNNNPVAIVVEQLNTSTLSMIVIDEVAMPYVGQSLLDSTVIEVSWGKESGIDIEEHYNKLLSYNYLVRQNTEDLPESVIGLHWFRDRLYAVAGLQSFSYSGGVDPSQGITAAIRHWWNMDETSSATTLQDQTGNADLSLINKASATFSGPSLRAGGGSSIRFTGNSAASSTFFPGWITQSNDYTVAAWVRPDTATSSVRRTIVGDAPAQDGAGSMPINYRIGLNLTANGRTEAFWEHGDGIDDAVICSSPMPAEVASLLVVSRNGTTREVVCHIDGVRVSTESFSFLPQGGGDPSKRLVLGNVQSLDQPFLGYMQDVAVFNRPLSDAEVAWLYNNGEGRSYAEVTDGNMPVVQRIKLTVPPQAEAMVGFPLYVDLSDLPDEVWDNLAYKDARDIRVRTSSGDELPFHLVRVDPAARSGSMFVRTDLSDSVNTEIYIHYGDPSKGSLPFDAPNGSSRVWSDYHRVFLFNIQQKDAVGVGADATRQNRTRLFDLVSDKTGLTEHQGVCWDGTHYYVVDTNAIHKYDVDWNLVASNPDPVGDVGNGTNHCGDPDIHNGILYVPVESYTSVTVFSNQRIARFRASDLSFIDSVSVSAQGDEVSTVCVDPEANMLWTTRYSDSTSHRINGYDLDTLSYAGSSSNTPGAMRVQGMKRWRNMWFVNGDTADQTFLVTEDLGTALRQWTDIADNASTRPGNYEGLGATDDTLLVLRDEGPSTTIHTISPMNAEAGGGFEAIISPDGPGNMRASGLTNSTVFTMGATVIGSDFSTSNQALLSFSGNTTANTSRVTLGYRATTGKFGVWDTNNTWLDASSTPSTGVKTRVHTRYNGTTSRSIFVDGVREGHVTGISNAPTGKTVLFMGAEDLSIAEPYSGKMGFVYIRSSALSDNWISAECSNLNNPTGFYALG